ncbi:MAG: sulfotransferase [Alphaproteobacteria bacterium]
MPGKRFWRTRYKLYYNLMMAHDVMQAALWRMIAPAVDDEAFQSAYRMIFVLGCGRSGTTIFSRCLGQHPDIVELNEPKHIWIGTNREADVLSPFARLSGGRLRFDHRDVTEKIRARYRAMVDFHVKRRSPIVCDKLPFNTCSVGYVAALNPTAKFIHLQRSPRAVALSIEQCVRRDGSWWGFNDYKWRALCRCAADYPELDRLIPFAVDDYYRGLVEWRINQHLAKADLSMLEPGRHIDVFYEDFIADPEHVSQRVCAFCEVPFDNAVADYVSANIRPRSTVDDGSRRSVEDDRLHAEILGDFDDIKKWA